MTEQEWLTGQDPRPMLDYLRGRVSPRKLMLFAAACCDRLEPLLTSRPDLEAADQMPSYLEMVRQHAEWVALPVEWADPAWQERWSTYCSHAEWFGDLAEPFHETGMDLGYWAAVLSLSSALSEAVETVGSEVGPDYVGAARRCCDYATWASAYRAAEAAEIALPAAMPEEAERVEPFASLVAHERAVQAGLLREVVGNPFRPVSVDRERLPRTGGTIAKLARIVDDELNRPSGHLNPARLAVLADALEEAGCDSADLLGHLRGPGPHIRGCWVIDLLLGRA